MAEREARTGSASGDPRARGDGSRHAPSLRVWLGVSYGLLAAVLVLVVSLVVETVAARQIQRDIGEQLSLGAVERARHLEQGLRERLGDLTLLAALPLDELAARSPQHVRAVFADLAARVPRYIWIGLVDAGGDVLIAEPSMHEGEDVSAMPWFASAREGPYLADAAGSVDEPSLDLVMPLRGGGGGVLAVVAARWSWNPEPSASLSGSDTAARPEDGAARGDEMLVVDAGGRIVSGPQPWRGRTLDLDPRRGGSAPPGTLRTVWPDGAESLSGHARIAFTDVPGDPEWHVLVRRPVAGSIGPLGEMRDAVLLAAIPLALLGIFAAVLLGRRIGAPLQHITESARRIQHGQGIVEVEDPGGYREARQLAASLRELVASLAGRESELRLLAETLEQRVAERTAELRDLNARLELLALSDPLTGLANRRRFSEELEIAVERALEQGLPLSVVMFDVDHFKRVNDTHGHPAGDAVLRHLAEVAAGEVRGSDLLARTGGEEFAVLAIDTGAGAAVALAERLRLAVDLQEAQMVGRVAIPVTISAGVASTEQLGEAVLAMGPDRVVRELLESVDAALYRAKQRGRNRVQSA